MILCGHAGIARAPARVPGPQSHAIHTHTHTQSIGYFNHTNTQKRLGAHAAHLPHVNRRRV